MNVLLPDEIERLRDAWARKSGVRAAARALGINRETVARYYKDWSRPQPMSERHREKVNEIARQITSPAVFDLIDAEMQYLMIEHEELTTLRRIAVRRHGVTGQEA